MKNTALILAAIASASAAFATVPAQAGGKRLQFGGPLGSFEATPYAKGSSRSHSSHSKKRSSHAAAKKAHARKLAAKKAHARQLAAKKAAAKKAAARKYAAQKAAQQKAAQQQIAAKKAHARKLAAKKAAAKKIAARKAAAAKNRDLAQTRKTEENVIETAATNEETTKASPVKASAIAGTNTLDFDRDEADVADTSQIEQGNADAEEEAIDETNDEIRESKAELECKKYIPSAGLTITVPCGS